MMQKQVTEVIFQPFSEEMVMESKQRLMGYEEIKFQNLWRRLEGALFEAFYKEDLQERWRRLFAKACSGGTKGKLVFN